MANIDAGIAYLDRVSKFAVAEHQEIYHVCRGMLQAIRESSGEIICVKCGTRHQYADGHNCEKRTIEINREVAEGYVSGIGYEPIAKMHRELRRALEAK